MTFSSSGYVPNPDMLWVLWQDAIVTLHGAAVLGLELLTRSQQQPPEQLLNAAIMLHDGVLIVSVRLSLRWVAA